MKTILITFLLTIVYTSSSFSQSHKFEWGGAIGGSAGAEIHHSSTTDHSGNTYVVGQFAGETDFDPGAGFYLLKAKNIDGYIMKLDADGNFKWVLTLPSKSEIAITSVVSDSLGFIYISGNYSDSIIFEIGTSKQYDYSSRNSIFYAKLDSNGSFIWAKSLNDKSSFSKAPSTKKSKLQLDPKGNIIITGVFENRPDFDAGNDSFFLKSNGYYGETFVLKTNSYGDFIWAKNFKATKLWNETLSFSFDSKNNIFLTGFFEDSMILNKASSAEILVSKGEDDMFLTKLDSSGTCIWAKSFGDYDRDKGSAIKIDNKDNILMAAYFSDTLTIAVDTGIIKIGSLRRDNSILIKFDNNGKFIWYKKFQGDFSSSKPSSIAQDKEGNIYLFGEFDGKIDFDPGVDSFIVLGTLDDIFLTKFDSSGSFVYAKTFQRNNSLYIPPILFLDTNSNNIYISGNFSEKMDANPSIDSFILQSFDYSDWEVFIIKLNNCTPSAGKDSLTICGSYNWVGQELTESGIYKKNLISASDCDSLVTLNLTILPKPVASITHVSANTLKCYNIGVKYQWVNCPSLTPIPNDTNSILNAPYKGYFAIIVSNGLCSDTSDCRYIEPLLGINDFKNTENVLKLYPNPFSQTATLEFENPQNKSHQLVVFNTMGQLVLSIVNIKGNKVFVERKELQSGLYFYQLRNEDGVIGSGKMMIK